MKGAFFSSLQTRNFAVSVVYANVNSQSFHRLDGSGALNFAKASQATTSQISVTATAQQPLQNSGTAAGESNAKLITLLGREAPRLHPRMKIMKRETSIQKRGHEAQ